MAEAPAGEVVVADLDHELRLQRLPFAGTLRSTSGSGRPARSPVKPGGAISFFELGGERRLVARLAMSR